LQENCFTCDMVRISFFCEELARSKRIKRGIVILPSSWSIGPTQPDLEPAAGVPTSLEHRPYSTALARRARCCPLHGPLTRPLAMRPLDRLGPLQHAYRMRGGRGMLGERSGQSSVGQLV
jgi:hypothetical protein